MASSPPPPRPALEPGQPRSRLALVAAEVLMGLIFASGCASFAGHVTMVVGERAYGEDCPLVYTALIIYGAALLLSVTFIAALLLLPCNHGTEAEKKELPPVIRSALMVATFVCVAFGCVAFVGVMLMQFSPGKRSRAERVGSVMRDGGLLYLEFDLW
ncbi:unnamed protein product [Urochloa humidicola]